MSHLAIELLFFGVTLALALASLLWRYRHPQLYAANVVAPGSRFNRIQYIGLTFMAIGVATFVGIPILLHFHPTNPNYRAGSLGESKTFLLVGAVTFLIGWNRRRKPDSSPPE